MEKFDTSILPAKNTPDIDPFQKVVAEVQESGKELQSILDLCEKIGGIVEYKEHPTLSFSRKNLPATDRLALDSEEKEIENMTTVGDYLIVVLKKGKTVMYKMQNTDGKKTLIPLKDKENPLLDSDWFEKKEEKEGRPDRFGMPITREVMQINEKFFFDVDVSVSVTTTRGGKQHTGVIGRINIEDINQIDFIPQTLSEIACGSSHGRQTEYEYQQMLSKAMMRLRDRFFPDKKVVYTAPQWMQMFEEGTEYLNFSEAFYAFCRGMFNEESCNSGYLPKKYLKESSRYCHNCLESAIFKYDKRIFSDELKSRGIQVTRHKKEFFRKGRFLIEKRRNHDLNLYDFIVWEVADENGKELPAHKWKLAKQKEWDHPRPFVSENEIDVFLDEQSAENKRYPFFEFFGNQFELNGKKCFIQPSFTDEIHIAQDDSDWFHIGIPQDFKIDHKFLIGNMLFFVDKKNNRLLKCKLITDRHTDDLTNIDSQMISLKDNGNVSIQNIHVDELGNLLITYETVLMRFDTSQLICEESLNICNSSAGVMSDGDLFTFWNGGIQIFETAHFGVSKELTELYKKNGTLILQALKKEESKIKNVVQTVTEVIQTLQKFARETPSKKEIIILGEKVSVLFNSDIFSVIPDLLGPVQTIYSKITALQESVEYAEKRCKSLMDKVGEKLVVESSGKFKKIKNIEQYKDLSQIDEAINDLKDFEGDVRVFLQENSGGCIPHKLRASIMELLENEVFEQAKTIFQQKGEDIFKKELWGMEGMPQESLTQLRKKAESLSNLMEYDRYLSKDIQVTLTNTKREKVKITGKDDAEDLVTEVIEAISAKIQKQEEEEEEQGKTDVLRQVQRDCARIENDAERSFQKCSDPMILEQRKRRIDEKITKLNETIESYEIGFKTILEKRAREAKERINKFFEAKKSEILAERFEMKEEILKQIQYLLEDIEKELMFSKDTNNLNRRLQLSHTVRNFHRKIEVLETVDVTTADSKRIDFETMLKKVRSSLEEKQLIRIDGGFVHINGASIPRVAGSHDLIIRQDKMRRSYVIDPVGGRQRYVDESGVSEVFGGCPSLANIERDYGHLGECSSKDLAASEYLAAKFIKLCESKNEKLPSKKPDWFVQVLQKEFESDRFSPSEQCHLKSEIEDAAQILAVYPKNLANGEVISLPLKNHPGYDAEKQLVSINVKTLLSRYQNFLELKDEAKLFRIDEIRAFLLEPIKKALFYTETLPGVDVPANGKLAPHVVEQLIDVAGLLKPQLEAGQPQGMVLFTGLPGGGKTTLTQILSKILNRKIFCFDCSQFIGYSRFESKGEKDVLVEKLWEAVHCENAIIFFDDIQFLPLPLKLQLLTLLDNRRSINISCRGETKPVKLKNQLLFAAENPVIDESGLNQATPLPNAVRNRTQRRRVEFPKLRPKESILSYNALYILAAHHEEMQGLRQEEITALCDVMQGRSDVNFEVMGSSINPATQGRYVGYLKQMVWLLEVIEKVDAVFDAHSRKKDSHVGETRFMAYQGPRMALNFVQGGGIDGSDEEEIFKKKVQNAIMEDTQADTDLNHLHVIFDTEKAIEAKRSLHRDNSREALGKAMSGSPDTGDNGDRMNSLLTAFMQQVTSGGFSGGSDGDATLEIAQALRKQGETTEKLVNVINNKLGNGHYDSLVKAIIQNGETMSRTVTQTMTREISTQGEQVFTSENGLKSLGTALAKALTAEMQTCLQTQEDTFGRFGEQILDLQRKQFAFEEKNVAVIENLTEKLAGLDSAFRFIANTLNISQQQNALALQKLEFTLTQCVQTQGQQSQQMLERFLDELTETVSGVIQKARENPGEVQPTIDVIGQVRTMLDERLPGITDNITSRIVEIIQKTLPKDIEGIEGLNTFMEEIKHTVKQLVQSFASLSGESAELNAKLTQMVEGG